MPICSLRPLTAFSPESAQKPSSGDHKAPHWCMGGVGRKGGHVAAVSPNGKGSPVLSLWRLLKSNAARRGHPATGRAWQQLC